VAKALLETSDLEARAGDAARLLKLLSNERRLLILCRLLANHEVSVGELGYEAGIGQSSLSQHLAKMRAGGMVTTRRAAQTIYYRIADHNIGALVRVLKDLYYP